MRILTLTELLGESHISTTTDFVVPAYEFYTLGLSADRENWHSWLLALHQHLYTSLVGNWITQEGEFINSLDGSDLGYSYSFDYDDLAVTLSGKQHTETGVEFRYTWVFKGATPSTGSPMYPETQLINKLDEFFYINKSALGFPTTASEFVWNFLVYLHEQVDLPIIVDLNSRTVIISTTSKVQLDLDEIRVS